MDMAAGAAGGLLGALTARPLARLIGEGPVTWLSLGVASPLVLVQPFLHRNWTLGLFVAAQIGFSAGVVIYNVTQVSFRQRLCPEHLLGRMNASMRFLVWGTMPLGGLLGGALGSTVGVRATLLVAAIGQSLAFLWVFFSPLRSLREVTASPDHGTAVAAPLAGSPDGEPPHPAPRPGDFGKSAGWSTPPMTEGHGGVAASGPAVRGGLQPGGAGRRPVRDHGRGCPAMRSALPGRDHRGSGGPRGCEGAGRCSRGSCSSP
jgi:hypothetical protein